MLIILLIIVDSRSEPRERHALSAMFPLSGGGIVMKPCRYLAGLRTLLSHFTRGNTLPVEVLKTTTATSCGLCPQVLEGDKFKNFMMNQFLNDY